MPSDHSTTAPEHQEEIYPWDLPDEIEQPVVVTKPAPITQPLPEPPVPADADLRTFPMLMVDMNATRSRWWITTDGAAFKAGLTLQFQSWSELPAGSLPDDDRMLCHLAGMSLADWREVKADALDGWSLCADGRLYHPEIARRVMATWESKMVARVRARKGAAARWGREEEECSGDAQALQRASNEQCSPMPTDPDPGPGPGPGTGTGTGPGPAPGTGRSGSPSAPSPGPAATTSPSPAPQQPAPNTPAPEAPRAFKQGGLEVDAETVGEWSATFRTINVPVELSGMTLWALKQPPALRIERLTWLLAKKEKEAADRRADVKITAEAKAKAGNMAPARRRPGI